MAQKFTNSPLVDYTQLSPNNSGKRTHDIDRISPHCVVGQVSVERLGQIFAPKTKNASSNYGIGFDGRVGMYVEEQNRSWCTSSNANDQRAVTIECASDNFAPYAFKDACYAKLIDLCTDICQRYGKKKLLWINDKNKALNYNPAADEMIITVHRWFAAKACPGDWLMQRLGDLATQVTNRLQGSEPQPVGKVIFRVQLGAYSVKANADRMLKKAKAAGFKDAYVKVDGKLYKVQVGAYTVYANATAQLQKCKAAGFKDAYITQSVIYTER